ncbi:unnamed protein product [Gongylonema pulchrum]|uniref:Uncharacterized protein n=1 Tax=Gongylonema pulchrum TaxID=637853 RepID=A0A3P6T785_9BILA|nr:unnamed protein product [Gongylonema pulchrum]
MDVADVSKDPAPTTQPVMRHVPVVFPTSRTFIVAPFSRMSGRRTESNQQGAPAGLRNRARPESTLSSKQLAPFGSTTSRQEQVKYSRNPQSKFCGFTRQCSLQNRLQPPENSRFCERSSCFCLTPQQQSLRSAKTETSQSPNAFDGALSSPTYLQALLESPVKNRKETADSPKPLKYIKIHYGPSPAPVIKQQPLRTRSTDIPSPDTDRFREQCPADFDYYKYLRPARRDRSNAQNQRVTVVSAIPDDAIEVRKKTPCYAQSERPSTIYSVNT